MTAPARTLVMLVALVGGVGCGRSTSNADGAPGGEGGTPGADAAAACSPACHPEAVCAESGGRPTCLQISAGERHACALVGGRLHCWGGATAQSLLVPALPQRWVDLGEGNAAVQVSVGRDHVCVLLADGTVRCWGSNFQGELGTGQAGVGSMEPVPATVVPRGLTMLSAGVNATCGITGAGALVCWGWRTFNQFGLDGDPPGVMYEAVLLPVTSAFYASDMRHFALTIDPISAPSCGVSGDSVLCLGRFIGRRRLGASEGLNRPTLAKVGLSQMCALDGERRLHCWGRGYGVGVAGPGEVEHPIPILDDVRSFALGATHTCAATSNGQLLCWGDNREGKLGIGETTPDGSDQAHWRPTVVPGLEPVVQVTAGTRFTCALGATGRIWCWGSNEAGQLGLADVVRSRDRPVEIPPP
jgi:hypothetical protein